MLDERITSVHDLFRRFREAYEDADQGMRAIELFRKLEDKSGFLEPAIEFLLLEEEDTIRSWGLSVLEEIGGERAFEAIRDLLEIGATPETKRRYYWTRFFALRALVRIAQSETQQSTLLRLLGQIWVDEEEDYLIQAEASALLAQRGRSDAEAKIRHMLQNKDDYWATLRALRALREFPLPWLLDEVIAVLKTSQYADHRYQAIRALGSYADALKAIRALGDVIVSDRNSYLRRLAVESLSHLGSPAARSDLVQALKDADAEVRLQAALALERSLSHKEAVSIIIEEALKEGTEAGVQDDLVDALRRIDRDRSLSTEILGNEMLGVDQDRAQLAERILAQIGGWPAVQKLGQRRKTLESLDTVLKDSEETIRETFEEIVRQARRNFYFAMSVNVLVVMVGLVLVILAIVQVTRNPGDLEAWLIPGGVGVFGVLFNMAFNNPRRHARQDLAALMNVNVIYMGFLRELNQIDATFKHAYIENPSFGIQQMQVTVTQIEEAVSRTLQMAVDHLQIAPSRDRQT